MTIGANHYGKPTKHGRHSEYHKITDDRKGWLRCECGRFHVGYWHQDGEFREKCAPCTFTEERNSNKILSS